MLRADCRPPLPVASRAVVGAAPGRQRLSRLVVVVAVLLGGLDAAALQRAAPLRIVHEGDISRVAVRRLDGNEMVALREVAAAVSGELRPGGGGREIELRVAGERLRIEAGRSFVGVGRRDRLISSPVVRRGGEFFVPLDFVSRVLLDVLPRGSRYEEDGRTLAVGGGYSRLSVDISPNPGFTRIEVATDPPVDTDLEESERGLRVVIQAPFVETAFIGEAPQDGVVERVDLRQAGESYVLEITTGRNYGRVRQDRRRGRLALELLRSGVRAESGAEVLRPLGETDPPRRRDRLPRNVERPLEIRTVALDPGHGGDDAGAAVPAGGFTEKELVLSVALVLARLLEREYGLEVVLTRETDRPVRLDDRAVMANSARADLLLSLHLNASPSPNARGTTVYHHSPIGAARPVEGQGVRFIAWEAAQAAAVPRSRALAEAMADALEALPLPAAGVADAPVRVLAGAAMPAVHIELGFVTSPDDREVLRDPDFPELAARALADGIFRFRNRRPVEPPTGGIR